MALKHGFEMLFLRAPGTEGAGCNTRLESRTKRVDTPFGVWLLFQVLLRQHDLQPVRPNRAVWHDPCTMAGTGQRPRHDSPRANPTERSDHCDGGPHARAQTGIVQQGQALVLGRALLAGKMLVYLNLFFFRVRDFISLLSVAGARATCTAAHGESA